MTTTVEPGRQQTQFGRMDTKTVTWIVRTELGDKLEVTRKRDALRLQDLLAEVHHA